MNAMQVNTASNPAAQQMLAQFMQQGNQPLIKQQTQTITKKKGTPLTPKGVLGNIKDQTLMPFISMKKPFDWNYQRDSMKKAFGINELAHMMGGTEVIQQDPMQLSNQAPAIDWSALMATQQQM